MNMQTFVINLPKNTIRLQSFIMNYYKSDLRNLPLNIVEAINGKKVNLKDHVTPEAFEQIRTTEKTGVRTHHHHLTRGAVGCYLSHLKIYNEIKDSSENGDEKFYLIFEDDSLIPENLYQIIMKNLILMPNDWDIINFSCICSKCQDKGLYKIPERFFLMNCYLINIKGVQKMLDYHSKIKIDKQIDSELSLMSTNKIINIYCSKIFIGQDTFKTDIQIPLYHTVFQDPFEIVPGANKNIIWLIALFIGLIIIALILGLIVIIKS